MGERASPPGAPRPRGYDRVVIVEAEGSGREISGDEFDALAPLERIRLLLGGRARFFRGEREVSPHEAVSQLIDG